MKRVMCVVWMVVPIVIGIPVMTQAQTKGADSRMEQDILVAENILGTLMRQEAGHRGFWPTEVKGTYTAGFGVTLKLPVVGFGNRWMLEGAQPAIAAPPGTSYSYSYSYSKSDAEEKAIKESKRDQQRIKTPKPPRRSGEVDDSTMNNVRERFMEVSKNFLADYGDVISGLKPDERIIISNRSDEFEPDFEMMWVSSSGSGGGRAKRQLMSVEAKRSDIEQLKQSKITRAEFLNRLKVTDTETVEAIDPDLEVLSSLFGRLYREDLSTTYYAQGSLRYERLKDFGVIYYMKVYSSMEMENDKFAMPTVDQRDLSQTDRDKKVKELYPKFESELKENIVEYGRTLRSLKDNEQLVFKVKLTVCNGCGIPGTLELSIPSSALKDYGTGKATREATVAKIGVKKTGVQ